MNPCFLLENTGMICRHTDTIAFTPATTTEEDDCVELIIVLASQPIVVEYIDIIEDRVHFIHSKPQNIVKCLVIRKHSAIMPGVFTNEPRPFKLEIQPMFNLNVVAVKAVIIMSANLNINKNINFMNDCIVWNNSLFQYYGIMPILIKNKYCDVCFEKTFLLMTFSNGASMCDHCSDGSTTSVKTICRGDRMFKFLRKIAPREKTINLLNTTNFINSNDKITVVASHI